MVRLHDYGDCLVNDYPSSARRLLSYAPGSRGERNLLASFGNTPRCLEGEGAVEQLYFQREMLRGIVAEAILRADAEPAPPGERVQRSAPFSRLSDSDIAALDEKGRLSLLGLTLAQCIDAAAPDAVAALFKTDPLSPDEDRAFRQIGPQLSPCLKEGAEMKIGKPQLRGFLAEARYRAAYAAAHPAK